MGRRETTTMRHEYEIRVHAWMWGGGSKPHPYEGHPNATEADYWRASMIAHGFGDPLLTPPMLQAIEAIHASRLRSPIEWPP